MSQMHSQILGPLIIGGSGRVGRMLAALWPHGQTTALWQRRVAAAPIGNHDVIWDPLATATPDMPRPINAVIVLAGVTHGTPDNLAQNTALAQAGCALGARLGVKTLIASSQAVYGRATDVMSEADTPAPATPYGQAKLDMEHSVSNCTGVTCLRIGNVAGCDGLFQAMGRGPIPLDQFDDGQGPRRMMIGPRDLADVLAHLSGYQHPLPKILNIASPALIAMQDLADAAGTVWEWQPAPATALPVLAMDMGALATVMPPPTTTATDLVAQARDGGWTPAP